MAIRLVKRDQQTATDNKPVKQSVRTQIILTTQAWIDEFKSRKTRPDLTLLDAAKRS